MRRGQSGAADQIASLLGGDVINARLGQSAHLTQALLDALTLQHHFKSFAGVRIGIVVEVEHS